VSYWSAGVNHQAWVLGPPRCTRPAERSVPVGRLAEPADIAHAAYFFADQRSDYITGQTLIVDGGQTLPEVPLQSPSGAAVFGGEARR
jgi:NAD(P)-dependent dehydrogenase (short-subunit alcohol dehydrogenase family)